MRKNLPPKKKKSFVIKNILFWKMEMFVEMNVVRRIVEHLENVDNYVRDEWRKRNELSQLGEDLEEWND